MIISNSSGTRFLQGWLIVTVLLLVALSIQSVNYKKLQHENAVLALAVEIAADEIASGVKKCDI